MAYHVDQCFSNVDWTNFGRGGTNVDLNKKNFKYGGLTLTGKTNIEMAHRVRYWFYMSPMNIMGVQGPGLTLPLVQYGDVSPLANISSPFT